jgi:hypothetical protein
MVSRGRVLPVVVAVVLVTAPLWGPALSLTGPTFEYRSVELTTANGTVDVAHEDPPYVRDELPIDCLGSVRGDRACVSDAGLLDGDRVVDYPPLLSGTGNPTLSRERYVAFGFGSPVYRRTADYAPNGSYRLGLERVPPERALREVATEPQYVPTAVGRAAERGAATTGRPLDRPRIVALPDDEAADPTFRLVYEAGRESGPVEAWVDPALLEVLAVLAGAWLLLGLRPPLAPE